MMFLLIRNMTLKRRSVDVKTTSEQSYSEVVFCLKAVKRVFFLQNSLVVLILCISFILLFSNILIISHLYYD